jgi:TM2 domain-containing membrane protein YozV
MLYAMKRAPEIAWTVIAALLGWTICAAVLSLTAYATSFATAFAVNSVVAPVLFLLLAIGHFRRSEAMHPSFVAAVFAIVGVAFAFVTALTVPERGMASLHSLTGTWLPIALVFFGTWGVGLAVRDPSDRMGHRAEHVEDL